MSSRLSQIAAIGAAAVLVVAVVILSGTSANIRGDVTQSAGSSSSRSGANPLTITPNAEGPIASPETKVFTRDAWFAVPGNLDKDGKYVGPPIWCCMTGPEIEGRPFCKQPKITRLSLNEAGSCEGTFSTDKSIYTDERLCKLVCMEKI